MPQLKALQQQLIYGSKRKKKNGYSASSVTKIGNLKDKKFDMSKRTRKKNK